ncbi:unnamed protein product [Symbiodinium sp. KB8]|nr:unnamed protein product [Symbiodinium sp. KB8]
MAQGKLGPSSGKQGQPVRDPSGKHSVKASEQCIIVGGSASPRSFRKSLEEPGMAGERLLQVRLDEGRTAEGQYQSNEVPDTAVEQCDRVREGRSESDREKGRHEGVTVFAALRLADVVRMLSGAPEVDSRRAKSSKGVRAGDSLTAVSIASRLTRCAPKASAFARDDRAYWASNGRLGKTSPGEEAGDITEKRSPAKVREHGHLVQGDRNFRNEGGGSSAGLQLGVVEVLDERELEKRPHPERHTCNNAS